MLWNFGTSACNVAFQDCKQGPVLAPNGSITAIASHNGSVFAKTVTNTNCEIHQNPFRSQKSVASSTKAALSVGAAVDSTGAAWAGTDALPFSVAMDPDRASAADALPASTTTSCEAGATASFGDVTYTRTGDYYYVISEGASGVDGMSAPTARVYAHVSVTSLDAAPTVTYGTASGTYDSTDPGTLTATYTAPSTKAALSVGAAVDSTGAAWAGTDALPFSVAMDPDRASAADAPAASTTASCEAGATASFGDVTYTHTGDYYYVISAVCVQ